MISNLQKVINIYRRTKFYSKTAKRIYQLGILGGLNPNKGWDKTFSIWVDEFEYFEENYAPLPILEVTGESYKEYIARLFEELEKRNFISLNEGLVLPNHLMSKREVIKPGNELAQAIILRTFFELSRTILTSQVGVINIPVSEMIDAPLDITLPL